MSDEQAARPADSVATELEGRRCDQCNAPLVFRKRITTRRFCNDRCRNDWHVAERHRLEAEAGAIVDQLGSLFSKLISKKRARP